MLTICRDTLLESYLLIVASDEQAFDAHSLDRALHRASRSGKQAIWLDCSLLAPRDISTELGLVLCAYAEVFAARGVGFVVAYAGPELRESLAKAGSGAMPRLVDSLVDAPPPPVPFKPQPMATLPDAEGTSAVPRPRRRAAGPGRPGQTAPDDFGAPLV
ncbi:MAG TPA: hypothetical protein VF629_17365 [Hymenobacter sp.]|jgi:hypothetical protein|uniref:hypothetical protein n=1 Tax=Hymenobacter sp. TaxID=1898978 RepID=UPI002EDA2EFF